MKVQKSGCSVAGASLDLTLVRPLGDAEQQAHHQIAPEQPSELLGQFCRTAIEQSGGLSLLHDVTQRGAARLAPCGIERPRHLGRVDRLGDRQSEYGDNLWVADLVEEPCSERSEQAPEALAVTRHRQVGR